MRQLGISVYPLHASLEDNKNYITLAAKYGFKRVFTCLLSISGDKEAIVNEFKATIEHANSLGMEVVADVAPHIFKDLDITYKDLSFFGDLKCYGIRLDEGFSGNEESLMTFNPHNLKIEINMSNDTPYVDTIMKYQPDTKMLLGCHNFYPHRYAGLTREHFRTCTNNFKKYGITTAAFVNSHKATFGPWPVDQGLCTLEEHRDLPIEIQTIDLFNEGMDIVIISNCFATEEELAAMASVSRNMIELGAVLVDDVPEIESKIIFEEMHFNRGDVSANMIRSTQSRVKYKGHDFKLFNAPDMIKRGDIIIESSLYGHYAGELQIAKSDMENSGKTNVVGHIHHDYLYLIDMIKPWQKFKFRKVSEEERLSFFELLKKTVTSRFD